MSDALESAQVCISCIISLSVVVWLDFGVMVDIPVVM